MPEFFWCFEAFRDLAGRFRWHNAVAFCRKVGEVRFDVALLGQFGLIMAGGQSAGLHRVFTGNPAWLWLGARAPAFTCVFTGSPDWL
jgi:hypothetical protein